MAPVPPYTTGELRAVYSTQLGEHTISFNQVAGSNYAEFVAGCRGFLEQAVLRMYRLSSFHTAFYRAPGQNFSLPVNGWVAIDSPGTNPEPGLNDTNGEYINFAGRSLTTGRRARIFLYGTTVGPDREMRVMAGESAGIAAMLNQLASVQDLIGAIDGTQVQWKQYVNVGINDYHIRRARLNA